LLFSELVSFSCQVLDVLGEVPELAVALFLDSFLLVLELGELPIFVEVVSLELVDTRVVLKALLLEKLELLFKCLVSCRLNHLYPLFLILVLLLQVFDNLLLHAEFMQPLRHLLIVSLI
jgi:hypothetical protein